MILTVVFYIFIAFLVYFTFEFVVYPYIVTKKVVRTYGEKNVMFLYYPVLGVVKYIVDSIKKHKDPFYYFIQKIQQQDINSPYSFKAAFLCRSTQQSIWIFLHKDYSKFILQNPQKYEKSGTIFFCEESLSESIFFNEGEMWQKQRHLVSDAFHFKSLKGYTPLILDITQNQIKQCIKVATPNKIVETCSLIAGEVVAATFFGKEFLNVKLNDQSIITGCQKVISDLSNHRRLPEHIIKSCFFGNKYGKYKFLLSKYEKKLINDFVKMKQICSNFITQVKIKRKEPDYIKNSFLDIFLDNQEKGFVQDTEIVDNFLGFFFAGIDTTGSFTGMCFYSLAKYQHIQQLLYSDFKKYFQNKSQNGNWQINHEDLNQFPNLNNFIKENFRFYNPAQGLLQRTVKEDHFIHDIKVKKGEVLTILTKMPMINPKNFLNPNEFDIDRWDREETKKIDPFAYTPFSAGPRNCIGQHLSLIETKIMIIKFIENYKLILNPDRPLIMGIKLIISPVFDDLVIFQNRN